MNKVVIDSREGDRVRSATAYYEKKGLDVETKELPIGDYVFNDKVAIEFKTIADFISSINDGRVFNEALNQAEEFPHHFVVIYGTAAERSKRLAISRNYQPLNILQYNGAIASLNKFTTVIESYSSQISESYYRMLIQAKKCLEDKPIVRKFPRKEKNAALNFLTYCIYGIGYKKAKVIVDTYNLYSLNDLMQLDKEKLMDIDGIGEKTAENILEAIQ